VRRRDVDSGYVGQRGHLQSVLVDRHVDDLEVVVAGGDDRVEVAGVLDRDPVARPAGDGEQQPEAVHGAVGDEDVLRPARDPTNPADVIGQGSAERREPGGIVVPTGGDCVDTSRHARRHPGSGVGAMYGMPGRRVRSSGAGIRPVGRSAPYGGLQRYDVRHEGAGAGAALDPAFGVELVVRRLRHGPGHGQVPGEVAGGWEPVAGLEPPVEDSGPELLGQLQVQWQTGGPIDRQRQRAFHES
jgi:hypothetical protein